MNDKPLEEKSNDSNAFDSGAKINLKPVGTSGSEIFAGYFSEEYLQKLRGRAGAKVFDEIRRSESQVAMLLNAVMNPIKAGVWEFEASNEVTDGEKHKEFIEYNAKEMIDWETYLHEALTFLIFGYSIFEVINNVVYNHPKFGTFNGLKALAFRSQKTIEKWTVDNETGDLKFVTQWVNGDLASGRNSTLLQMPAEHLLVITMQKEGDNYEGISALRPMYGAWFRKNLYLKIAAIGMEKNAIGTPIGTIPKGKQDNAQLESFKEVLGNFTGNESAFLMKPEGWDIEVIKNDFDPAKVKELIVMENTEMINSLVANFLALGTSGGGGSFALGTDLSDFFLTGIQNYANLIAGIWNRKLIPNLIKLNFGPQLAYPKLKATGINDKAGKELAEIVTALLEKKGITADDKLESFLRKSYNLPAQDSSTSRQQQPEAPKTFAPQLSETRLQLAESYRKQWNNDKEQVKEVMQVELNKILDDLKNQIARGYKQASPANRVSVALNIQAKSLNYKNALQEVLAKVASNALASAKKETPKAKNVILFEMKLAAPRDGYFDSLPPAIKKLIRAQADLISSTQANDLDKIVSFQYQSSQASTENLDQILTDISEAAAPTIEGSTGKGMSLDAAAGNAVSSTINQTRLEWFFEPEVLDTIESFTFVNEDPISEICQELSGKTWAVGDPDLDRYSPPLHHNCKSRIEPNEKGAKNNPEIETGGTSVSQKALNSITLHECNCDYHLHFQLKENDKTKTS